MIELLENCFQSAALLKEQRMRAIVPLASCFQPFVQVLVLTVMLKIILAQMDTEALVSPIQQKGKTTGKHIKLIGTKEQTNLHFWRLLLYHGVMCVHHQLW